MVSKITKSGYRGVCPHPTRKGSWITVLFHNKKKHVAGPFTSKRVAAEKYDEMKKHFCPNAKCLNFTQTSTGKVLPISSNVNNKNRISNNSSLIDFYKNSVLRCDRIAFSNAFRQQFSINRNRMCDMCSKFIIGYFEIDHILPLSLYGNNDTSNLQLLCFDCHKFKSNHLDRIIEQYIRSLPSVHSSNLSGIQKQIIEIQRLEKNRSSPSSNSIKAIHYRYLDGTKYLCIPFHSFIPLHSNNVTNESVNNDSSDSSNSSDTDDFKSVISNAENANMYLNNDINSVASDHDIQIIIEDPDEQFNQNSITH
jgi:hypothetical protein